ncbi:MAG TPA: glutamate racemase, partial [Gemmatimonadaceae bacterium]|nr:glutamate racemase [Gemmatimonadaceae bacterium]
MVAPPNAPIGVFDSGIGGLTVVRELMRQLPAERIIYFGDTARVPYGPKSPETVRRYSREITSYLQGEGVKVVVVACNTATAHALPTLQEEFSLPVLGVVEPGARAAARATTTGRIGVI